MPPTFDVEAELHRHGASLRALAGALLGDRDAADDVVQATWLRAVERPPLHEAAPGGWLATVLRNFALRWRRGERRRQRREELAARSGSEPDIAMVAAHEELLQRVVDALRSLPQPYRSTIWMRYLEDVPPAVIAARMAVPVATVKSRLQRGLAMLRKQLEGAGGSHDFRAGLLAVFGAEIGSGVGVVTTALLGVLTMTSKAKLVVTSGFLLLLLVGAFTWWPAGAPDSMVAGQHPTGVEVARTELVAEPAVGATSPAAELQRVIAVHERPVGDTTGTLLVRAVRSDRSPVAQEALLVTRKGEIRWFTERSELTDAAGQARFEGLAPGTMTVRLLQNSRGITAAVAAGGITEVEFVLPEGLAVRGLVVDREQRPLAGAEVVLLEFDAETTVVVATTGADGRFALRHVFPMSMLGARTDRHAASRWQMLQGSDGGAVDVVIELLEAGGVVEGVVLGPDGLPVRGAYVRVGKSEFEGPVSSRLVATAVPVRTSESGRFRVVGLAAGEHPVVVRAAGLVPWRGQCFVSALATITMRIDLVVGVTCTGIVRDASGAPAAGVQISPRGLDGATWLWTETAGDGTFTLSGLEPGAIELRASHAELGKASMRVNGEAGETVACELALSRGIELYGRVLDAAGAPVPDLYVRAVAEQESPNSSEGLTDAAGRFVLANCAAGLLRVTAQRGSQSIRSEHVDPRQGELELRLLGASAAPAATVRIRGTVFGPDGEPVVGTLVTTHDAMGEYRREEPTAVDGSFEFAVSPGTWHVYVPPQLLPGHASGPRELAADEMWDLGRIQLVTGGTATVQVQGAPAGAKLSFSVQNRERRRFGGQWLGEDMLRTSVLAPGEYCVQVWCDGFTRRLLPFTIRAGEKAQIEARLERGVRQRLEVVRADGAKVSGRLSHSLHHGDETLIDNLLVYWDRPPVYALDGALTAEFWLAPGAYRLEAMDAAAAVSGAQFTVGEHEAAP
ncbi:MAG: sigma-70 family RNA polymerase sigma factor, partial [Planctomycetota bacterium]